MRLIYSILWLILLPFFFLYLLWRARKQPEYLRHWPERLGLAPKLPAAPVIWLHAVSVGETRAAAPLIEALCQRYPDHVLLLTHATPTGRETGAALFGGRVRQAYLPYDLPFLISRFLKRVRPDVGIFMETEIWPNLYAACRARDVPIYLVNARMSERSAKGYARFSGLTRPALACLAAVAAQTEADAARLQALGAACVQVTGNLKFDVASPEDVAGRAQGMRSQLGVEKGERLVLLAASTREGEEALILDAFAASGLAEKWVLVIVPRHPQRFNDVAKLITERGLEFVRRSEGGRLPQSAAVFLGDSMGEMAVYYHACDLAFVGGSVLPLGGQNMIEACAAGKPVLIGPHTWNFRDAADQAVAAGAAIRVQDAAELMRVVADLSVMPDRRQAMARAGVAFTRKHQGATERVMALLNVR